MKPLSEIFWGLANRRIEIPFQRWFPKQKGAGWFACPFFVRDSLAIQQHSLLLMLAYAHERQLDPVVIVESAAAEARGSYRHKLFSCARRMQQGAVWLDALEQTPGVLSDDHIVSLRTGLQSGSLSTTYKRAVESDQHWLETSKDLNDGKGAYYIVVVVLLLIVLFFIGGRIMPKMVLLEKEFGMERSFYLHSVYGITYGATYAFRVVPWYITILAILLVCIVGVRLMRWVSPIFRRGLTWTTTEKAKGNVLRILSSTCESGRPIHGSLSTLAKYHLDRSLRRRLLLARNELEQGAEPWDTLVQAKLLRKNEAAVLQQSKSRTSHAWILDQLADLREHSHLQWMYLRSRLIHWIVTLLLGAFVLFLCLSIFESLPRWIQVLSAP